MNATGLVTQKVNTKGFKTPDLLDEDMGITVKGVSAEGKQEKL